MKSILKSILLIFAFLKNSLTLYKSLLFLLLLLLKENNNEAYSQKQLVFFVLFLNKLYEAIIQKIKTQHGYIRAYSRSILRSTIECCPLLRKLYEALMQCKTFGKGTEQGKGGWGSVVKILVPFFHKKVPFFPNIECCLNFKNMPCMSKLTAPNLLSHYTSYRINISRVKNRLLLKISA